MASVSDSILDAAVTLLGSLTFDPVPSTAFTVKKRKWPTIASDAETSMLLVGRDGPEDVEDLYLNTVLVRYPIAVAIAVKEQAKLGDTATVDAWREQINRAMLRKTTFAGVSGINVADRKPAGPVWQRSPLDKGWTWSAVGFVVEVIEARTS